MSKDKITGQNQKAQYNACREPQPKNNPKIALRFTNPLSFQYAQINRQFELIKESNQRCKETFPDCFHHKVKLAAECSDLIERLSGGESLLKSLNKRYQLTDTEKAQLTAFNLARGYLTHKLVEICKNIAELQGKAE